MFWMRAYPVFWPQMALAYWLDAIAQGQKTLEFQGPTLSDFPRNGYARIQNIMHGAVYIIVA